MIQGCSTGIETYISENGRNVGPLNQAQELIKTVASQMVPKLCTENIQI